LRTGPWNSYIRYGQEPTGKIPISWWTYPPLGFYETETVRIDKFQNFKVLYKSLENSISFVPILVLPIPTTCKDFKRY